MSDKTKYSANELAYIRRGIEEINGVDSSKTFKYGLNKNILRIDAELETIRKELKEASEGVQEYQQKLQSLILESTGKSDISEFPNGLVQDSDLKDRDAFYTSKKALDDEYKETLEEQTKINKENEEFLNEKIIEIDFYKIPFDAVPESLSQAQLFKIMALINEPA